MTVEDSVQVSIKASEGNKFSDACCRHCRELFGRSTCWANHCSGCELEAGETHGHRVQRDAFGCRFRE